MAILKTLTGLLLACALGLGAYGQTAEKTVEAFAQSYQHEANKAYTKAIQALSPYAKAYEVHLRLGWLHYLAGQYEASGKHYQEAIDQMPYAVEPRLGLAYPLAAQAQWQALEQNYKAILQVDPKQTTAHYQLALMYYNRKSYDLAQTHLTQVVNLYPFDYDAVLLLAWTQLQQGQTARAKELFYKALRYQPTSESAREGLRLIQ